MSGTLTAAAWNFEVSEVSGGQQSFTTEDTEDTEDGTEDFFI